MLKIVLCLIPPYPPYPPYPAVNRWCFARLSESYKPDPDKVQERTNLFFPSVAYFDFCDTWKIL